MSHLGYLIPVAPQWVINVIVDLELFLVGVGLALLVTGRGPFGGGRRK